MVHSLKKISVSLLAVMAISGLVSGSALAQAAGTRPATTPAPTPAPHVPSPPVASPVIVFSLQRLVSESVAGRDMSQKISTIAQGMNTELETEATAISAEQQTLLATPASQLQSPEVRRADAALQARMQAFDVERQRAQAELQATRERALNNFAQALQPVIEQVVRQRNALVLLEDGNVAFSVGGVDATDDMIAGLNTTTTSINVVRIRIQTEEEAAAAAAAAGAAAPAAGAARPAGAAPAARPATPAATGPLPRRPTPVPVPAGGH